MPKKTSFVDEAAGERARLRRNRIRAKGLYARMCAEVLHCKPTDNHVRKAKKAYRGALTRWSAKRVGALRHMGLLEDPDKLRSVHRNRGQ